MANAQEFGDQPAGLRVYTAMNYIETEGEWYGIQVTLVPYLGGTKVLWRSGNGKLDVPFLLDARRDGKSLRIIVPASDQNAGVWVLSFGGPIMHAAGPRGLHFDLRETPFR